MSAVDDAPMLDQLLRAAKAADGLHMKDLAHAIGVDASRVTGWGKAIADGRPIYLNETTRASIRDLVASDRDRYLEGMKVVLGRCETDTERERNAVAARERLRRELLSEPVTPADADEDSAEGSPGDHRPRKGGDGNGAGP